MLGKRGDMITDAPVQLTFRLFGTPDARIAGRPLALNDQKARALLYYLAATGQPHTREHLATLLWSETVESKARHSLRSSLYHIRRAFSIAQVDETLTSKGRMISLKIAEDACDVTHFRRLLNQDNEQACLQAIALYCGPLLQGFMVSDAPMFEEWARFEESTLRQSYTAMLHRLLSWARERHEWDQAIAYSQRMLRLDPLNEEAQQQLIKLYIRTGAVGQALRQYQQFEADLKREFGLQPAQETQRLLATLLETRHHTPMQVQEQPRKVARAQQTFPFVGREQGLQQLLMLSQEAIAGQGVTILLQGEDGIGKSRLLDELVRAITTHAPSWLILRGACSPFDDLVSYGPFLEAFQQAEAGDLTDLLLVPQDDEPPAQGRFLWRVLQALRVLAHDRPLLLALDDLQWANSATLHLFGFLATRLRNLPVMLVGTVQRVEAIPALQRLVTLGRRHGDVHLLPLTALTIHDVVDLTNRLGLSANSASTLAQWLYERSGGSPFILIEVIAQLRAEGILLPTDQGLRLDLGHWLRWRAGCTLPETTHDLVTWRLANLSPETRGLLDILAVANQPLPLDLLRTFPGMQDQHLLAHIENLLANGLLVEVAHDMFALPHHLLRETLILPLSHLRHRAIHRQLATILEACPALQKNFSLRQLALHAVIGEDVERARRYGLQVLDELMRHNANTQIADFLHHLYDLLAPTASTQEMLRLTQALGRVHQWLGQLEEAAFWHRQHLDLAYQTANGALQAAAHFEFGELALVANDYEAAISASKAGLAVVSKPSNESEHMALQAQGHRLLGAALAMEGSDLAAAERHLQDAVAAHKLTDNMNDLCATLFELGNVAAQRGELLTALRRYEEATHAAQAAHNYYFLALSWNNLAYHSLLVGCPEAARQALMEGKTLAETHELFGALMHLASTQGELHLYLGEWEAAAEALQYSLSLAEELNNLERQAGCRTGLALAERGQHKLANATALLKEALTLINERGYWHLRTRIQFWLVEILLQQDKLDEAASYLEAALQTAETHGRVLLLLQGQRLRAYLLAKRGDWPTARALFAQTLAHASRLNLTLEVARTQAGWGEMALLHTPDEGQALLAEARQTLVASDALGELSFIDINHPNLRSMGAFVQ
ncbi:MAG TPA: AAA family ATPase [Ktedonobacteraceae bacterium]|nr:AAA family ATPase [Ktedonobacteraceae bacterium]